MTILTDGLHLISDESITELHKFAAKIGMKREWFQDKPRYPHYDMTVSWRARRAIQAGAQLVTEREIVFGLRRLRRQ